LTGVGGSLRRGLGVRGGFTERLRHLALPLPSRADARLLRDLIEHRDIVVRLLRTDRAKDFQARGSNDDVGWPLLNAIAVRQLWGFAGMHFYGQIVLRNGLSHLSPAEKVLLHAQPGA